MPTIPIIKFAIAYYNSCNFHYRTGRQHTFDKGNSPSSNASQSGGISRKGGFARVMEVTLMTLVWSCIVS